MTKIKYEISYDKEVKNQFKYIEKKHWNLIKSTIEKQLTHQPGVETRNKKPLTKPNVDNRWELRFGPRNCFRVFYEIYEDSKEVLIVAVGKKEKEKIIIGKKEI